MHLVTNILVLLSGTEGMAACSNEYGADLQSKIYWLQTPGVPGIFLMIAVPIAHNINSF